MKFSIFGQKLSRNAGILQLMDDLGRALGGNRNMLMLGGGNPGAVPEVQASIRAAMEQILATPGKFEHMVGDYGSQKGDEAFIKALADLLRRHYQWPIRTANIALTNGSQNAFFLLFNLLGGDFGDKMCKKILLPLTPEYIGYADVSLAAKPFCAYRPRIAHLSGIFFKYQVDFEALRVEEDIAALCVSRPTNPTGNVLSSAELQQLRALARAHDIPLIIDGAYGAPFPHIIFDKNAADTDILWDDNTILCLSLSKFGLPAARTGIVIAREEIIQALAAMNAITNLAPASLGTGLALELVRNGELLRLSREAIQPFYYRKMQHALNCLQQSLDGIEFYLHQPEGALFLWLWFKDLPGGSLGLYQALKDNGVLTVPGDYFFPGLENDNWAHKHECLRLSYAQDEAVVEEGIARLGRTLKALLRRARV
jgi:valine--pyruvate aminotransferase